jgi:hypothetical protein
MTDISEKKVRIIRYLAALEPADDSSSYKRITPEQGNDIARLFEGDINLFRELDEKPGHYMTAYYHGVEGMTGYNVWHYKLRQARNDPRNQFFDILAGRSTSAN